MNKILFCTFGFFLTFYSCKKVNTISVNPPDSNQIIADHSVIADFGKIPPRYLAEVKKMMVYFPGESHSQAYREGMVLLNSIDSNYACHLGTGEAYTDQYLRVNHGDPTGEAEWFTWYAFENNSFPPFTTYIKRLIKEYSDNDHPMHVIGFAWCWDLFARRSRVRLFLERFTGRISINRDPIYGVHWYGASFGGPDGNREWGLDSGDYVLTANNVNTDTYLKATDDYITYCKTNGYITNVVFTTGPADFFTGEAGYQGYLKHQYIRNYVAEDPTRILFDYNDILCYDDNGSVTTTTWKGHTYPVITKANLGDGSIGHIGLQGAIRLAKAQWWLLARIAGWDGK